MNVTNIEQAHSATVVAPELATLAEVTAYSAACRRGDVLPVCIRLTAARADADWALRSHLARDVGPACEAAALDQACTFMPEAPEPRLLRAGRSIAVAGFATSESMRDAWLAFAQADLLEATRLDPIDPTARAMLADLVGSSAWAATRWAA